MKNIKKNKGKNTNSRKQEVRSENKHSIPIVEPPQIKSPPPTNAKSTQIGFIGSSLPPEYAIAILPHISSDERKKLIDEIGKENERYFDYASKKRNQSFWFKIFSSILFVGLLIFFVEKDQFPIIEKLLDVLLAGGAGAGYVIYRFVYKKMKQ